MNSGTPDVSITIVSHNEGERLGKTVDSLSKSLGPSLSCELIVLDDASDDSDSSWMRTSGFHSIVRNRFERTAGLVKARHYGACLARGKYVVFLDAHMAFHPGWLDVAVASLEKLPLHSIVSPQIGGVDEETWAPTAANQQVLWIDRNLDMVWEGRHGPTPAVPLVLGCCWIVRRESYFRSGGFDVGMTRWGCENIDIVVKAYAIGGGCFIEPGATVGHLFRSQFPYDVRFDQIVYNKLRLGYVHFPERSFHNLLDNLSSQPGYHDARERFFAYLDELREIRALQEKRNRRPEDWYLRTFLPELLS